MVFVCLFAADFVKDGSVVLIVVLAAFLFNALGLLFLLPGIRYLVRSRFLASVVCSIAAGVGLNIGIMLCRVRILLPVVAILIEISGLTLLVWLTTLIEGYSED